MNKIESFISENKEAFNQSEPSAAHFDRMKKRLGLKPRRFYGFRVAAAVLVMLGIFSVAAIFMVKPSNQLPANIAETQLYYKMLITKKINDLKQKKLITPCQLEQIKTQIAESQIPASDLFSSATENPNSDFVINAIIRQYQVQSQIIDNVVTHKYFCNNHKQELK